MDSLRYLLKKKAAFVSSPEHDGNPPTDEQLASFLRNLTAETGLALRGAPPGVSFRCMFSRARIAPLSDSRDRCFVHVHVRSALHLSLRSL